MSSSSPTRWPRGAARVAALAASALLLLAACGDDDGDAAAPDGTSTTSSTEITTSTTSGAVSSSTTSTTERAPRAFVTGTTLQPLVAPSTTAPDEGTVALSDLEVGDCADLPGLGLSESVEVTTAELVDCDDPHGVEVYLVASLNEDADAPYPGDAAVLRAADETCYAAFADFVGADYLDSSLEIVHVRPDAGIWEDGDRRVHCGVHARDLAPLTGSVRGSGR